MCRKVDGVAYISPTFELEKKKGKNLKWNSKKENCSFYFVLFFASFFQICLSCLLFLCVCTEVAYSGPAYFIRLRIYFWKSAWIELLFSGRYSLFFFSFNSFILGLHTTFWIVGKRRWLVGRTVRQTSTVNDCRPPSIHSKYKQLEILSFWFVAEQRIFSVFATFTRVFYPFVSWPSMRHKLSMNFRCSFITRFCGCAKLKPWVISAFYVVLNEFALSVALCSGSSRSTDTLAEL